MFAVKEYFGKIYIPTISGNPKNPFTVLGTIVIRLPKCEGGSKATVHSKLNLAVNIKAEGAWGGKSLGEVM